MAIAELAQPGSSRPFWNAARVVTFAGWLLPAFLAGVMIVRCVIQHERRLLWYDEFLSWYPATGSFTAMLASTADTINNAPPLYFVSLWAWLHAVGDSGLALRLFSTLAVGVAIFVMFGVLRRAYGALAAAVGLVVALAVPELLYQSSEGRFHALFLAEVAVAVLVFQRLQAAGRPSRRLLLANAGVYAAMAMTSYMAVPFSAAFLAAFLAAGALRRRLAWREAGSLLAGWTVFALWIPALLRQLAVSGTTWVPVPTPATLWEFYHGYFVRGFWPAARVLGGFALAGALLAALGRARWRRAGLGVREAPLVLLGLALAAAPLLVYAHSIRPGVASLFLPRYLLPALLGWCILFAQGARWALRLDFREPRRWLRHVFVGAQVAAVVALVWTSGQRWLAEARALPVEEKRLPLPDKVPPGEKVVVEFIHEFMGRHYYDRGRSRIVFAVDFEAGRAQGGSGLSDHAAMAAMKRYFPERFPQIMTTEELFAERKRFWILRAIFPWTPMRVENNPDVTWVRYEGNLIEVNWKESAKATPPAP